MGKEKKERRDPSSSDDGSDGSRDRHKRQKKEKKEKKDKKDKHKKRSKHGSRDKEQERLVKEAKKFLKKQLQSGDPAAAARGGGAPEPPAPRYEGEVQPITEEEYFTKHAEFAAWLKESRGKFFSEQSTEENRAAFGDFVAAWNGRQLAAKHYTGEVAKGAGGAGPRTSFAWGIKGPGGAALATAGAVGMAAALDEELNLKEQARAAAVAERQQQRREAKEYLEEAVPKLSGKDKVLEEKAARRQLAKAGGDSPEHLARGFDVLGGGEDSFAAARARDSARQQQRGRRQAAQHAEVAQRVAAARAAEEDKMAAFRALLHQGPIQIAKRQP